MQSLLIEKNEKQDQKQTWFDIKLFIMLLTNFIMNLGFSYIIPFYPVLANKQAGLDFALIGFIMSANSIGSTLFAYIFGSRIQIWGRKRSLNLSLISQGIVMALYASLSLMTNNYWLFVIMSFAIRLLQGMSRSVYGICSYSYVNLFWSDTFAQKFSHMETTAAVGSIMGPLFGSYLYASMGWAIPLYGQGVLFVLSSMLTFFYIPNDNLMDKKEARTKSKLPLSEAMTHKSTALTFITLVITRATINYFNAFFVNHMFSYGMNESNAAIMISVPQFSYIFTIMILPKLINSEANDKFLNSLSLMISILGGIVLSPAWKNNGQIWNVWLGLLVIGIGSALNRLPAIPVLVKSIINMGYSNLDKVALNDMASALFQMNLSMSNLIFPLLGGAIYDKLGGNTTQISSEFYAFKWTMLTLVFMQIFQFLIDSIFNGGLKSWINICRKKQDDNLNLKSFQSIYIKQNLDLDKSNASTSSSLDEILQQNYEKIEI